MLRRSRLEQRRTLADVARDARVSVPYLSEVERGRKEASSEVLAAVCDALRIELSDLLAEVGRDLAERTAPRSLAAAMPPGGRTGAAPRRRRARAATSCCWPPDQRARPPAAITAAPAARLVMTRSARP